jgi:hypothetical protein
MRIYTWITLFLGLIVFGGCQGSEYERRLKRELASGVRHDSIFLGLYLGMPNEVFFDHCYQLNQQRLVKEGLGGLSVEYRFPDQNPELVMYFSPRFFDDKVYQIEVQFTHPSWSPWNRDLWSEKLVDRVMSVIEQWHGPGFFRLENPERGTLWVKIDGNRRIVLNIVDDQFVRGLFTDVPVELSIQKQRETSSSIAQ